MELRHLRYFVTVAREMNFRRAAKILNIAQPPLSMQIKVLENELGVELFDRSKRAIILTAAGLMFLVDARRVLAEALQAETNARNAAAGSAGCLRIGFMLSTAHELLGSGVQKFKQQYPNVRINLFDLTNSEQIEALMADRIDIAFTRSRISKPELATETLLKEPMILMVPTSDSLAKKPRLAWKDLNGKSIITLYPEQSFNYYDGFFAKCKEANISVITGQYASDINTEMWLVSIGMGVAPTSLTTSLMHRPNLSFCELPSNLPKVQTAMSWKLAHRSPTTANFISIMRKLAANSRRK